MFELSELKNDVQFMEMALTKDLRDLEVTAFLWCAFGKPQSPHIPLKPYDKDKNSSFLLYKEECYTLRRYNLYLYANQLGF